MLRCRPVDQRIALLEATVEKLTGELGSLAERLSALEAEVDERPRPALPVTSEAPPELALPELAIPDRPTFLRLVTLAGRSLMALGGAYLLRALTDAGTLAPPVGVGLGLLYAAIWLALARRSGARDRPRSATFHGLTATAIAFPLVWEATGRLAVLSPSVAALLLIGFAVGGLRVAARQDVRLLAWSTTLFGIGVGAGLLFRTHALLAFGTALLVLGALVLWATYRRGWTVLRWLGTFLVDGVLLLCLILAIRTSPPPDWLPRFAVLLTLLGFAALYLAALARRTLGPDPKVGSFEVAQMVIAVAVGIGGAARLATGPLAWTLGAVVLALAVGAYACAFRAPLPERDYRPGLLLYSSLGAVLTLIALRLLLPPPGALLAVGGLGLAAAWLGISLRRRVLEAQAAFFAFVLAIQSGLLRQAADVLFAAGDQTWARLSAPGLAALAVVVACRGILLRRPADESDRWVRWSSHFARIALTALLLAGAGAVVSELLAGPLAGAPGPEADRGALAALRTTVLALAAVVLALIGRWPRLREAAWLVYPVLVVGGLKFLLDDLPNGRAGTLFVSLVVLGGALLAVSRLGGAGEGRRANLPTA